MNVPVERPHLYDYRITTLGHDGTPTVHRGAIAGFDVDAVKQDLFERVDTSDRLVATIRVRRCR